MQVNMNIIIVDREDASADRHVSEKHFVQHDVRNAIRSKRGVT